MTSAPRSPSSMVAKGPTRTRVRSRTRRPWSGPAGATCGVKCTGGDFGERGVRMRFENKVAVITGSGRGIGAATAARLAAEGAAVVVSDLDAAPAEETAGKISSEGGKAKAIACDVTSRESVEALMEGAKTAFGRLDILVACAGLIRDNLIYKMTDEDWDLVIDTHLKGTFYAARAAQKLMVEQRYGRMVFLSSTSALGNRGQANYSTAKAGLQGMARTLAIELGRYGITVNAVAPGFVETPL